MIDDDLDDLYERAWDDGYRAALRVLHEADDDQLDQDEDNGTTVTSMGDTGNGKIEASGVVMFLACAAAAVAAVGAWGELTKPIGGEVGPYAFWFIGAVFLALLAIYMKLPSK
jgi:hypothetical protein